MPPKVTRPSDDLSDFCQADDLPCKDQRRKVYSDWERIAQKDTTMAKSQRKSNKEIRKPKAVKLNNIAANAPKKDGLVAALLAKK